MECPLCAISQDSPIWQDEYCCVIDAGNPDYPGYYRVIWGEHVAEMSDLDEWSQRHLMDVVLAVECSLRALMAPDKINLASFGNQVPHLHWHVMARFADDPHFPEPIWGQEQRHAMPRIAPARDALSGRISAELARISATC
ncbi:MAG: HIT family protein [Azoarcus sp.]|jgi:diadenosine tetraphosphate (Ap4A) HIT family hydrolase|nr:HIT family protein [Azoarcus sp.]